MSLIYTGGDHRRGLAPLSDQNEDAPGWDDQQVGTTMGVGGGALANVALLDTPARILAMSSVGTDAVTFYAQLPHRWDRGEVRPHLHWIPLTTPAAPRVVRFTGQYAWSKPMSVVPANGLWVPLGNIDVPLPIADGQKHLITTLAAITPVNGESESTFLIVHLIRDGASASDTYTDGAAANVGLLGMDVHFRAEKMGTYEEYPVF